MSIARQLAALGASPAMIAGALCNGKPIAECEPNQMRTVVLSGRFDEPGRIQLVIPGPAPGKPRMTNRDRWAKRPAVVRYRDWCDLVRSIAGDVPAAEKVTCVDITAHFEPPKSWSKRKRCAHIGAMHRTKPDCDNITKAVLDCLWQDDSRIAWTITRKRWDWNARLEIEIVTNSRAAAGD